VPETRVPIGADAASADPVGRALSADVRIRRGAATFSARLDVAAGDVALIVGPSGAGKTSVLRALAGLVRPEDGTIRCGDATWFDAHAGTDLRPRDRRVGVVVQELALFPHLPAWRNVAFAAGRDGGRAEAVGWLERLGLADRADARPAALSGGERQRVALARALVRPSTALLLDEPFSALDDAAHDVAAALVREVVAERRVPAVVVSHDPGDAARLGAPPMTMQDGVLRAGPAPGDR